MRKSNPVARHARAFNKAAVQVDRKKAAKRRGSRTANPTPTRMVCDGRLMR